MNENRFNGVDEEYYNTHIVYKPEPKRKWTSGQRLNSAAEVMQALLDGEKLQGTWPAFKAVCSYCHLINGVVVDQDGKPFSIHINTHLGGTTAWTIYTPPKRKVKSERWFAVYQGGRDGTFWSSDCDTEEFARKAYSNALTYVRAECEVEVEE